MPLFSKGTPDPFLLSTDHDDTRRVVIEAARSLVGKAAFLFRGRTEGAVDCVGLCKFAADRAGLALEDALDMPEETFDAALLDALAARMDEIDPDDAQPGDWFAMTYRGRIQHFALLTERGTLIQASKLRGFVTEHDFTEREQSRVAAAYRFREFA